MLYYWRTSFFVKSSWVVGCAVAVDHKLNSILAQLQANLCDYPFAHSQPDRSSETSVQCSLIELLRDPKFSRGHSSDSLADGILQALQQSQALSMAPPCPIVAVLGMLNAGKSSMVATFVGAPEKATSDLEGTPHRRRVLIGSANNEGTHRFVVWLPEAWKRAPEVWSFVQSQLRAGFGSELEMLSESPSEAARQYNDVEPRRIENPAGSAEWRDPIQIPLIATDSNLDRLGIALMDCPDVQTGIVRRNSNAGTRNDFEDASANAAETRFEVLAKAAPLCSAFIVVMSANSLHDQTVTKLLKLLEVRMPHVQRMLAVNRVPRRYTTQEIAREVSHLYRAANIRRIYMAYHFDGPQQRDRIPSPPRDLFLDQEQPLPLFFRIDGATPAQPPAVIPDPDWLIRLGGQLQANDLLADAIRSANTHLTNLVHRGLSAGRTQLEQQFDEIRYAQQVIADACVDFSLDPNSSASRPQIRLQASRQVVQQIAESLERTAPWWARPGRWAQRVVEAGKSHVAHAASWFRMPIWISDRTQAMGDWIRARFKKGETGRVVTADTLCSYLASRDRRGLLELDTSTDRRDVVRAACQRAIDRFQSESRTQLDPEQIDELTRRIWDEMPIKQRVLSGVAPAGILFAPLVAVIMVPLDFGGTSVLVFASLKELLFAGAAGVGLMLASSDRMPQLAESESAWQQLSDLIAVLTDELGYTRVPVQEALRVQLGESEREVVSSAIPQQRASQADAPGVENVPMQMDPQRIETIHSLLDAIDRAQRT